jgi:anhydro-N-acetylmuramic acid kinase
MFTLGLMTGTALDGVIDVATLHTDGTDIQSFGPWSLENYDPHLRPILRAVTEDARRWNFEGPEPASFADAERLIAQAHAKAVLDFLRANNLTPRDIDVVGFHGQTVLHRPPQGGRQGRTRQLGDGALLARLIGIDVVNDFRSADMEAGGQGAPLAPVYHAALMRFARLKPPAAALNLGGVANVTWWGGGDEIAAFDTGPANGPLNDWIRHHTGEEYDRDGAHAGKGTVHDERLARMLEHPYLARAYPKSLDRFDFTHELAHGLGIEDGAATLTALTAATVEKGLELLPARPHQIVLCGGGRHNPAMVAAIRDWTKAEVVPSEAVGWRGDAIEAEAFAYLAARSVKGLPLSLPTTTGVRQAMTGGRLHKTG